MDDSTISNNTSITSFFKHDAGAKKSTRKKHSFFVDRNLTSTVNFDSWQVILNFVLVSNHQYH